MSTSSNNNNNNPVPTKFSKAQKNATINNTNTKGTTKKDDATKSSIRISPEKNNKRNSEINKILTAQPPVSSEVTDDENTAMHLLLNFRDSGNKNKNIPGNDEGDQKNNSNGSNSPSNSSGSNPGDSNNGKNLDMKSLLSQKLNPLQSSPFFLNPLNPLSQGSHDLFNSSSSSLLGKRKLDAPLEISTDLPNLTTIGSSNESYLALKNSILAGGNKFNSTTDNGSPSPSNALDSSLGGGGLQHLANNPTLNNLFRSMGSNFSAAFLQQLQNDPSNQELLTLLGINPATLSAATIATAGSTNTPQASSSSNVPADSNPANQQQQQPSTTSSSSYFPANAHHPITPHSGLKLEYNIIQHFEPRFYQVFLQYKKFYEENNNPSEINIKTHLLSLCLEHMISFCNWARENPSITNWVKTTLDDNADLRPEVRNGISMILMYCFSAAQSKLRTDSDMFIALQDTESGLGIVNKTSLKIYNDPFQFFNFIKSCITGLIDAGKIPENERINKPKKSKPQSESKDEIEAFFEIKRIIIEKLNKHEIDWVKERIQQISNVWYRRQNIRSRRFVTALAILNTTNEVARSLPLELLAASDVDLAKILPVASNLLESGGQQHHPLIPSLSNSMKPSSSSTSSTLLPGAFGLSTTLKSNPLFVNPDARKSTDHLQSTTPSNSGTGAGAGVGKDSNKSLQMMDYPVLPKSQQHDPYFNPFFSSNPPATTSTTTTATSNPSDARNNNISSNNNPVAAVATAPSPKKQRTSSLSSLHHDKNAMTSPLKDINNHPRQFQSQQFVTVYRFERVSLKEWNIIEQKILHFESFLTQNAFTTFYLIDEYSLLNDNHHQQHPQHASDQHHPMKFIANSSSSSSSSSSLSSSGMMSLFHELQNHPQSLITSWSKRDHLHLLDFIDLWTTTCSANMPASNSDEDSKTTMSKKQSAKKNKNKKPSLLEFWNERNPMLQQQKRFLSSLMSSKSKQQQYNNKGGEQDEKNTNSSTSPMEVVDNTAENEGGNDTDEVNNHFPMGLGVIGYEIVIQIGLVVRKNPDIGLNEDCWRLIYLSDLQNLSKQFTNFAHFLMGFFPQLFPILTPFLSTNTDMTTITNSTSSNHNNNNTSNKSLMLIKYFAHQFDLPIYEPPSMEKLSSYQTIGLLNETTEMIFSRFNSEYVFHDIILQAIQTNTNNGNNNN